MSFVITEPYQFIAGLDGLALDGGYIYYGEPNQDPIQYPKAVYADSLLTIPMPQPLRTVGGYVVRNGSPTFLFTAGNYSVLVLDKFQRQVYMVPDFQLVGTAVAVTSKQIYKPVDNVAALRALDKNIYSYAETTGYFTAGDGGQGQYYLDASDTTSADNGGTIIVATDGGRWKLHHGAEVSAACFGVIPGLPNVSTALNAALADHVGKYRLKLPQGTINTSTTIINVPGGCDVLGTGPANTGYGNDMNSSTHGTKIVSAVVNDYAVKINDPNTFYGPGSQFGQLEIENTSGKGLRIVGLAAGAHLHNIVVRNCPQEGYDFYYYQDSVLDTIECVNCGTDVKHAVTFENNCNAVEVRKMLIIQCRQPLLVDGCTYVEFYDAHIEQGEYPPGPLEYVNTPFLAGGFNAVNSSDIRFIGGIFVPNSYTYLASYYSIANSATPFYFTSSGCLRTKFIGSTFSAPRFGCRFVSAQQAEFINCTFNSTATLVNGLEGTTVTFDNCDIELYDDQTQTNFTCVNLSTLSEIRDTRFRCSNPASATKTSGIIIDGTTSYLGNYRIEVDKTYQHVGPNLVYRGATGYGGFGYSLSTGTIDIMKQNAGEAIVIQSVSGNLTGLSNIHGNGTKYTVVNDTNVVLTVTSGGNISTPAPISVPQFGSIDLKHIPGTSILSPVV